MDGRVLFVPHLDNSVSWYNTAWELVKEIEATAAEADNELLCQSSLMKLWLLFFSHSTEGNASPNIDSLRLKTAIDYMHTHFAEQITVHDLAKLSHMSEGHFSRTFKVYMKISPVNYLIQLRIDKSINLLQKSDLSIGEIALNCGFNDFSYFCKIFRKKMNCSPHDVRDKAKKFL